MQSSYNTRNPAVRRLMKEAQELSKPTELFFAQPTDDNLFEWHFTVRGPPDSDFDGGIYHGRISLPADYPMKPPSIMILTPNGRFELAKKICLSISGFHPESWQPSWSTLLALIGFMPTSGAGAIGSLEYPADERKRLAKKSLEWRCDSCNATMKDILPALTEDDKEKLMEESQEARDLATQISFKDEAQVQKEKKEAVEKGEESMPVLRSSTSEADLIDNLVESHRQEVPVEQMNVVSAAPIVEPHYNRIRRSPDSGSLVLILLLSVMIAVLVFRRFYLLNEWRFTTRDSGDNGEL